MKKIYLVDTNCSTWGEARKYTVACETLQDALDLAASIHGDADDEPVSPDKWVKALPLVERTFGVPQFFEPCKCVEEDE